jgi:hypothetical protein
MAVTRSFTLFTFALSLVAAIVACGRSDALFAPGSHLPSGEWGADRIQFGQHANIIVCP